jgi:hypothetical protein
VEKFWKFNFLNLTSNSVLKSRGSKVNKYFIVLVPLIAATKHVLLLTEKQSPTKPLTEKVQLYLQWFDSHSERNFAASLQPLQIDVGDNYESGDAEGDVKKLTFTRVEDTEFGPSLQRTSK